MLPDVLRRNSSCGKNYFSFPIFLYAENLEVQKGALCMFWSGEDWAVLASLLSLTSFGGEDPLFAALRLARESSRPGLDALDYCEAKVGGIFSAPHQTRHTSHPRGSLQENYPRFL
jgi:hypothetical protein